MNKESKKQYDIVYKAWIEAGFKSNRPDFEGMINDLSYKISCLKDEINDNNKQDRLYKDELAQYEESLRKREKELKALIAKVKAKLEKCERSNYD